LSNESFSVLFCGAFSVLDLGFCSVGIFLLWWGSGCGSFDKSWSGEWFSKQRKRSLRGTKIRTQYLSHLKYCVRLIMFKLNEIFFGNSHRLLESGDFYITLSFVDRYICLYYGVVGVSSLIKSVFPCWYCYNIVGVL
jgi:hypothetical protein